jgi:hypothetical protein
MSIMNSFINDAFERIAVEAGKLVRSGSQPVAITADHEESNTFQGAMPLTVRQSTDGNAANESGADICAANP